MFSFQDVESARKLAQLTLWPLAAAAVYMEFGIVYFVGDDSGDPLFLYWLSYSLSFVIQTVFIAVSIEAIDYILTSSCTFAARTAAPIFGICMLALGFMPLHYIGASTPELPISALWAFACLSWGCRILSPNAKKEKIR